MPVVVERVRGQWVLFHPLSRHSEVFDWPVVMAALAFVQGARWIELIASGG